MDRRRLGRISDHRQTLQRGHAFGYSNQPQITVVGQILNYRAVFPAVERSRAKSGNLRESCSGHSMTLSDGLYFGRGQHAEMPAYRFVSEPLPFMIEELEVAGRAAAHGQVDVQGDCRIAGTVVERVVMPECGDRLRAALRADQIAVHRAVRIHGVHQYSE